MRLELPDVTICAADCVNPRAAARALELSMTACGFGDAILFSDIAVAGSFRTMAIERLNSAAEYSEFIIKKVPKLTHTAWVLIIQWDGYVVNPTAWIPEFQSYDYIGAKWLPFKDGATVGNGGFSIRSRKLLDALTLDIFPMVPHVPEDVLICRHYRPTLEREFGIRFAPESLANKFSYEEEKANYPTFGFHGMENFCRHVSDGELKGVLDLLDCYVFKSAQASRLIANYYIDRNAGSLSAVYGKLRGQMSADEAFKVLRSKLGNRLFLPDLFGACERLWLMGQTRRPPAPTVNWRRLRGDEPCACGSGQQYQDCHGDWTIGSEVMSETLKYRFFRLLGDWAGR